MFLTANYVLKIKPYQCLFYPIRKGYQIPSEFFVMSFLLQNDCQAHQVKPAIDVALRQSQTAISLQLNAN